MTEKELNEKVTDGVLRDIKTDHHKPPFKVHDLGIISSNGVIVAERPQSGIPKQLFPGNAQFIVKAVNNHEPLLEGCEFAVRMLGRIGKQDPKNAGMWFAARRQIQAAIDAAEKVD